MSKTLITTSSSGRTARMVTIVVAVALCLFAALCLGGLGIGGGASYFFSQSTAQARQTESAQSAETATAEAQDQQATRTALAAQNQQATEAALGASADATATSLAKWAASTATAQTRIEASTATAQARATAGTPTPLTPGDLPVTWPVRFSDTFDAEGNDWPTGLYKEGDYGSVNRSIAAGKYRWQAETTEGRLWRANYTAETASDVYLAVDVLVVTGDANTRYGLVVRDDGQNYYYFDAGDDGQFAFYLRYNDQWTTLIRRTSSTFFDASGVNRLGLLAQGDQFTLYVNGQSVAEATDSHLREGLTGVGVNLNGQTPEGVYEFDDFEFRTP